MPEMLVEVQLAHMPSNWLTVGLNWVVLLGGIFLLWRQVKANRG